LGVSSLPLITEDSTDRNRTLPFAFTGNKFEFRMCGSSNNIAEPCFTLNTAVAMVLSEIADALEKAEDKTGAARKIIKELIAAHQRVIFNGNNYTEDWVEEAARRGLPNISNTVLAIRELLTEKSREVFTKMKVLTEKELESRYKILLENISKTINIEAMTFIDMTNRQLLPATLDYASKLADIAMKTQSEAAKKSLAKLTALADEMGAKLAELESAAAAPEHEDAFEEALYYRETVVKAMEALRAAVDAVEPLVPADVWPVPVYADLLFRV
jgi:glutamine synthetase